MQSHSLPKGLNTNNPAIGFLLSFSGYDPISQYDAVCKDSRVAPEGFMPNGAVLHLAGKSEEDLTVVDLWHDYPSFNRFTPGLEKALAENDVIGPDPVVRLNVLAYYVSQNLYLIPLARLRGIAKLVVDRCDNVLEPKGTYLRAAEAFGPELPQELLAHVAGVYGDSLYIINLFTTQAAYEGFEELAQTVLPSVDFPEVSETKVFDYVGTLKPQS
jgi:hypothetical protein